MARPLRVEYEGACYHVMNRGSRGERVYHSAGDYDLFLRKLAWWAEMFRVSVRAYCLMPNHFHVYLCTRDANLCRFMQSFLTAFGVAWARRHGVCGAVFGRRFKGLLVEDDAYGAEVSRHIHLNPVRVAGLEDAELAARRKLSWERTASSTASGGG